MIDSDVLQMKNITKKFPGVTALKDVSFNLKKGEIHALVGENGAGKSTLMKILSGFYPHGSYLGDIYINGETVTINTIKDSKKLGISIIYQDLILAKNLTIGENIFLGEEPSKRGIINWDKVYSEASYWLSEVGLTINSGTKVSELGVGEQQLLEIAKALSRKAKILILDEPTAALNDSEIQILMKILNELRESSVSCIYISHKLNEVLKISDRITVLRDGVLICTKNTEEFNESILISKMVGRELKNALKKENKILGEIVFEIKNFNVFSYDKSEPVVKNVNFYVKKGEILGISGLMGSGRTELLKGIFGAYKGYKTGEIYINGLKINIESPIDSIKCGISLVPEDRRKDGLILLLSVLKNVSLAILTKLSKFGIININKEITYGLKVKDELNIKTPSLKTQTGNLSGGNQQKVIIAKWLALENLSVLLLDEPTRGIDVGAKLEIYNIIYGLAKRGIAIIMASSELLEILSISDRILIMYEGSIKGELDTKSASEESIMQIATSGNKLEVESNA